MATAEIAILMAPGDKLSRAEFLRRWAIMPNLKKAELIGGIVYMPSPLSRDHAEMERFLSGWLLNYQVATPGCRGGNNSTWLMGRDHAPQPDLDLCLIPERGGQSHREGKYVAGCPEFLAEVCVSSASYDLHLKRDLYHEKGVKENLVVLLEEQEIRWFCHTAKAYKAMAADAQGIYRSKVFPGLWLDGPALLKGDTKRVIAVLDEGLKSPEHAAFLKKG